MGEAPAQAGTWSCFQLHVMIPSRPWPDGHLPRNSSERRHAAVNIFLVLAISTLLGLVVWGLVSRRQSRPCPVCLRWLVEMDNPFCRTNRAAVIIEHLDLHAGMTVLDVGCGPGRLTVPTAKHVGPLGSVLALDLQTGMLARAQEKAQAAQLNNIRFLHAGIGDGALPENHFDRALLVTVLGEIPEPEAGLREIFRALKPGGILSVTEIVFDPHFQSRQTVARLAGKAGFREGAFYGNRLAYTLMLNKPNKINSNTDVLSLRSAAENVSTNRSSS